MNSLCVQVIEISKRKSCVGFTRNGKGVARESFAKAVIRVVWKLTI